MARNTCSRRPVGRCERESRRFAGEVPRLALQRGCDVHMQAAAVRLVMQHTQKTHSDCKAVGAIELRRCTSVLRCQHVMRSCERRGSSVEVSKVFHGHLPRNHARRILHLLRPCVRALALRSSVRATGREET